jgi:hypothetical protein
MFTGVSFVLMVVNESVLADDHETLAPQARLLADIEASLLALPQDRGSGGLVLAAVTLGLALESRARQRLPAKQDVTLVAATAEVQSLIEYRCVVDDCVAVHW